MIRSEVWALGAGCVGIYIILNWKQAFSGETGWCPTMARVQERA